MKILILKIRKIFLEKKYFEILIFFFIFISLLFLIIYIQNTLKKPYQKHTFKEGLVEDININLLNPLYPKDEYESTILNIIYPPLIEFDNGIIISKFIKSAKFSSDYLTLTIELKDIKWSDGSKITTDDLAFSFDLHKKFGSPNIVNILKNASINIIDTKKAEFKLNLNDNYFIYELKNFRILPKKEFAKVDLGSSEINQDIFKIGSGPFVFKNINYKKNIKILTLQKNIYFSPQPYFNEIQFYIFNSPREAYNSLLLKEIDALSGVNYIEFSNNIKRNYYIKEIVLPRIIGIFFNSQKINSEEVNYLNKIIDRKKLVKEVFKNRAEVSYNIISPTILQILKINLQNSENFPKELNKNIDLSNIKILTTASFFYPEISRWLKKNYNIDYEIIKNEDLYYILEKKDYIGILTGININYPPSVTYFFSKIAYNINNVENIELEKLFQDLTINNQVDSNKTWQNINKILSSYNVFLTNVYYTYIINKKIKGFDQFFLVDPSFRFSKIYLWSQK